MLPLRQAIPALHFPVMLARIPFLPALLAVGSRYLPRGSLVLLLGTLSARAISTVGLLVTAAILGPSPYAALGVYVSILSLLSVAACGRYEAAILAVRHEGDARALVMLSQGICALFLLAVSSLCALVILMGWNDLVALPAAAMALLPLGILARVKLRIENLILTRSGRPRVRARSAIVQSIVQPLVTLASYWIGADAVLALVLGDAVGHLVAAFVLRMGNRDWRRETQPRGALLHHAAKWRQMPLAGLPNAFLSIAFDSAPALLAGLTLPPHLGGQMILALRLLDIPGFLVGFVAVPTLQRAIVEDKTPLRYALRPVLRLALMLGGMFLAIIVMVHFLSPLLLHTRWPELFRLVQWFALSSAFLAVTNPLIELVAIYGVEVRAFRRHLASLLILAVCTAGLLIFGERVPSLALLLALAGLARAAMFARLLFQQSRRERAAAVPAR